MVSISGRLYLAHFDSGVSHVPLRSLGQEKIRVRATHRTAGVRRLAVRVSSILCPEAEAGRFPSVPAASLLDKSTVVSFNRGIRPPDLLRHDENGSLIRVRSTSATSSTTTSHPSKPIPQDKSTLTSPAALPNQRAATVVNKIEKGTKPARSSFAGEPPHETGHQHEVLRCIFAGDPLGGLRESE